MSLFISVCFYRSRYSLLTASWFRLNLYNAKLKIKYSQRSGYFVIGYRHGEQMTLSNFFSLEYSERLAKNFHSYSVCWEKELIILEDFQLKLIDMGSAFHSWVDISEGILLSTLFDLA